MKRLQAVDFEPHLGSTFQAALDSPGTLELRLDKLSRFETSVTEGFSLLFTGPRDQLLGQGIRPLRHPAMGELEIFLVPVVDPRTEVCTYEAVFNRMKAAAADAGAKP